MESSRITKESGRDESRPVAKEIQPDAPPVTEDGPSKTHTPTKRSEAAGAVEKTPASLFRRPTLWEFIAGPIPGWSPHFQQGRPVVGILTGTGEIAALFALVSTMRTPDRPDLSRYIEWSLLIGDPSGGSGPAWGNQHLLYIYRQAFVLGGIDRILFDPVYHPYRNSRLIDGGHYRTLRRNAVLLFLSVSVIDTLSAFYNDAWRARPPAGSTGENNGSPVGFLIVGWEDDGPEYQIGLRWRF